MYKAKRVKSKTIRLLCAKLCTLNVHNEERHNLTGKYPERVEALRKILMGELDSPRSDVM
jgi:hypothetical protein